MSPSIHGPGPPPSAAQYLQAGPALISCCAPALNYWPPCIIPQLPPEALPSAALPSAALTRALPPPPPRRPAAGGIYGPVGPQASYASGSVITISLLITAKHGGRHMFRLCPSSSPDEACFAANVLQRWAAGGRAAR